MLNLPLLLAIAAPLAAAADSGDVEFLTALVLDFKALPRSYFDFLATANPPPQLTSLALQVQTYTDDLYTTLLDGGDVNVGELKSFASKLPWALRLDQGGAGAADTAQTTDTPSATTDKAPEQTTDKKTDDKKTDDKKTDEKKTDDKKSKTNGGGAATKLESKLTKSKKGDDKNTNTGLTLVFNDLDVYIKSLNSENSKNIAGSFVAPAGAVLGAIAVALL